MGENMQDAEKAWEEHIAEVAPYPAVSFPDPEAEKRGRMYKSGYMAGRASRDAEVDAFVIAQRILREQLAEAKAKIEQRPSPEFRDALIADRNKAESALADAQATIAAMTDATDVRHGSKSERLLKIAMLGSAPSSTGGN